MIPSRTIVSILLAFYCLPSTVYSADLIPFSLPWHDENTESPSVLTLQDRDRPAGKDGFIHLEEGHFFDGAGKRIRLLGVNLSFSGNYPTHRQADSLAGHMAKYGINCVRFHHTDTQRAPNGIWKSGTDDKQLLDPENLDRMDYFINALKQKGIYSNINLKIGREVVTGDGFTEVDRLPTYDKGPDHYVPRMIELQKQYARDLLTHQNPYTGNRYVDEPALAIVEINNESGLVSQWAGAELDAIPLAYIQPLQTDWNAFLQSRYPTTEALREAWAPQISGSGEDLLSPGLTGWVLQQVEQGKGTLQSVSEGPDGSDCLKVDVTSKGTASWHVQLYHRGLQVKKAGYYKLKIQLRADPARTVSIGLKMDHDPWQNLDDHASINITPEWKTVELAFTSSQDESQARLDISGLANQIGSLWISNPSLIDSSPEGLPHNQTLEEMNIAWIPRGEFGQRAIPIRRDWIDFLIQRETHYYREMNQYLKQELKLRALVTGTQLGFGTALAQLETDFIDIHAYWNHPHFPNQSWDSVDWTVTNQSILSAVDNPLERMMASRIAERAFTCTEYNHPAPNTYSSEAIPLLAAYAALQDWDAIFYYSYSHSNDYASRSINNFFDICGHTPKMLALPAAYNMLVRGDISPAQQIVSASMTPAEYNQMVLDHNGSLWFNPLISLGIPGTASYQHRTALHLDDHPPSIDNPSFNLTRRSMDADTGELRWNQIPAARSYVLIRAEKTKGFVGFINDMTFDLGHGIQLEVGDTLQNWANILLTYLGTDDRGHRWLLTATGYHENQGMKWKNEEKNSVGNQWGQGPPLVEPIPIRLTISSTHDNQLLLSNQGTKVISLNNLAEPKEELPQAVHRSNNDLVIDLMESPQSLWYEIRCEANTAVSDSLKQ